MGLFEKKYCDLCGDKVNALTRQKLSDGYLCSDCKHKLSSLSSGWKNRTLADVKAHLEQREQNRQKYSAFVQSASAGTNEKLVVDFNNRKFYFTIGRDFKNSNAKPLYLAFDTSPGKYVITVSKPQCITRVYEIYLYKDDISFDVNITVPYDVNMDGVINVTDVTLLQIYIAGLEEVDDYTCKIADTNGDGTISIVDVTNIQNKIVNLL